jgi:DNA-binding SARP family transcriptional activator
VKWVGGIPSHRYHSALALSIRFQNVAEATDGGERTRIQLCGRLSVEVDSAQVAERLRGKQVPLLLAYLVLNRARHVGRDELITALWPEDVPRSQDAALRTLLSRLRAGLGRNSLLGRDELRLALPEPIWIDIEAARVEMERALRALEDVDVRTAWALAQVPLNIASRGLLPGSHAEWLEPHRRELEDIRLQALEVVGRAGLSLGGTQLASVERAAHGLIETEPYRESGYVLLMEALAAQGNVAEALRAFERLRSLLRDELGTTPSAETLAVHERLLHSGSRGWAGSDPAREPSDRARPARPAVPVELPAELRAGAAGPLVGRKQELEELLGVWETVRKGEPVQSGELGSARRVLLLAGEAGIGKTRLLAELARVTHERGALVLAGRSPEESVVPYQPFLEALRHYVLNVPFTQLRANAREYGSELARLVPELRRRAPELPPPPAGEPETERYRLFEAVVGLLAEISTGSPVLLVLDDLHWADKPTLMLLRHLARGFDTAQLLIVGAYRVTEATGNSFGDALSDLRRARAVWQFDIGGLSESETAELIALQTGGAPSREFSRALHEETEGNPLFVEEIVRHLIEVSPRPPGSKLDDPGVLQEVGLPETVKDVIARRLARLDAAAKEWLRVAAVIGRDFDAALLEQAVSLGEDEFLNALDEALAAGLVVEAPGRPGRYSFSHALIRETLYEGMSAPRRARIHRRVGEALEAADGRGSRGRRAYLVPLAYHFMQAAGPGEWDRAITYAIRAGEQATALLAHEQAVDQYAGALEVLRRFAPEADERRCELLIALGEAQVRVGDHPRAWEAFREAATIAEDRGDSESLVRAAIGAARRYIQQPGVVETELIELLERANEMTREQRTPARVQLLARLCGALYYSPERDRMAELAYEAGEIARELDDPEALANACAARRRALWDAAHLSERLETSTEMLTLARRVGDTELELQAHAWLVVDLLEDGDRDAVDAQIEAFTAGAEQLRQPLYSWHAIVWRAMRALLAGHLDQAEEIAGTALAAGARAEAVTAPQYYAIQLLAIRREQERISELEQAAREMVRTNPGRPAWRAALATLMLESGHIAEAQAEFELLAQAGFEQIPRDGDWMIAITLLSDVCVGLGDAPRAEHLYDLLLPYAGANVVIGLAAVCLGSAARILGKLAGTMGSEAQATAQFERALIANEQLKAPVALAHTQLDYAQLLGGGAAASKLVVAAARAGERLELPSVLRRASELQ